MPQMRKLKFLSTTDCAAHHGWAAQREIFGMEYVIFFDVCTFSIGFGYPAQTAAYRRRRRTQTAARECARDALSRAATMHTRHVMPCLLDYRASSATRNSGKRPLSILRLFSRQPGFRQPSSNPQPQPATREHRAAEACADEATAQEGVAAVCVSRQKGRGLRRQRRSWRGTGQ
jgi:hypothetical protein